jgi:hypothetical protein
MSNMVLAAMPEEIHEYLTQVVMRRHTERGLPPEELSIAAELWKFLNRAQIVDYSKLGEAEVTALSPNEIAIDLK